MCFSYKFDRSSYFSYHSNTCKEVGAVRSNNERLRSLERLISLLEPSMETRDSGHTPIGCSGSEDWRLVHELGRMTKISGRVKSAMIDVFGYWVGDVGNLLATYSHEIVNIASHYCRP